MPVSHAVPPENAIHTDPIDSVEQIPAAFGQLAQKLEEALREK
jgi:hypothetical protein